MLDKLTTNFLSETTTVRKRGKRTTKKTSELDLVSNLSSGTELDADIKHGEENTVRRSKKLTKTTPIIRYNNPICHDYRKHRRKAGLGSNTQSNGHGDEQPQLIRTTDNKSTSRTNTHRDNHESEDRSSVHKQTDHWRNYRHIENRQNPFGRTTANSDRGNVEDADNLHN